MDFGTKGARVVQTVFILSNSIFLLFIVYGSISNCFALIWVEGYLEVDRYTMRVAL